MEGITDLLRVIPSVSCFFVLHFLQEAQDEDSIYGSPFPI